MDGGSSHRGHTTTTHASYGFVLLRTIHAIVEKDKSFNTQRMLAHRIQATQTTAMQTHTIEGCVRGQFAVSRTRYHHTRIVRRCNKTSFTFDF